MAKGKIQVPLCKFLDNGRLPSGEGSGEGNCDAVAFEVLMLKSEHSLP